MQSEIIASLLYLLLISYKTKNFFFCTQLLNYYLTFVASHSCALHLYLTIDAALCSIAAEYRFILY